MSTQQEQTETPQEAAKRIGASLMAGSGTSLEDLAEAGWHLEINMGGNVYFRHEPTRGVLSIPFWATQMRAAERKAAVEDARRCLREALGLEEKPEFRAV